MKFLLAFASFRVVLAGPRKLLPFAPSLFIASLIFSPIFSVQAQKLDAAAVELKRGKVLHAKQDYAGAIASYSKAIELRPDWAVAYVQRGLARRMQGELDDAIKDYDKAMELDPASLRNDLSIAEAYINHGFIRRNALQIEAALVDYDKAAKLLPTLTQTYLQRGQARLLDETFAGAIADFDYFIANEKHSAFDIAFAYADRSLAKRLLGKTVEAEKDLQESLRLMKGKEEIIHRQLAELAAQLLILRKMHPRKQKVIARSSLGPRQFERRL